MAIQRKFAGDVGRPLIHEFHDYRDFLKEWFSFLKREYRISLRKISSEAGLASGYLPSVIAKKFSISDRALEKIQGPARINDSDLNYIRLLRTVSDAEDPQERFKALEKIERVLNARGVKVHEVETYKYLDKWYNIAIREMVNLPGFKLDPQWIQEALGKEVSLQDIRKSIEFLIAKGFITIDKKGKASISDKPISMKSGFYRLALYKAHTQMLELEKKAIENVPREDRFSNSLTIAASKDDFDKIKGLVEEFNEKIADIVQKSDKKAEAVYHFSLGGFQLARQFGGKKDA